MNFLARIFRRLGYGRVSVSRIKPQPHGSFAGRLLAANGMVYRMNAKYQRGFGRG